MVKQSMYVQFIQVIPQLLRNMRLEWNDAVNDADEVGLTDRLAHRSMNRSADAVCDTYIWVVE